MPFFSLSNHKDLTHYRAVWLRSTHRLLHEVSSVSKIEKKSAHLFQVIMQFPITWLNRDNYFESVDKYINDALLFQSYTLKLKHTHPNSIQKWHKPARSVLDRKSPCTTGSWKPNKSLYLRENLLRFCNTDFNVTLIPFIPLMLFTSSRPLKSWPQTLPMWG